MFLFSVHYGVERVMIPNSGSPKMTSNTSTGLNPTPGTVSKQVRKIETMGWGRGLCNRCHQRVCTLWTVDQVSVCLTK